MLETKYISIKGNDIVVESGGIIDSTGGGYPAGQGPGAGTGSAGGSFASAGGLAAPERQYGSLFLPSQPGSGGGYGAGGAWLEINTGSTVAVDGIITNNGKGGGTNGGGSGGTVNIKTVFLKGYGTVEASGGNEDK